MLEALKQDYKKIAASGHYSIEDFLTLVESLAQDNRLPIPKKFHDHVLIGEWKSYSECHIKPEWLLIYQKAVDTELILVRTGSQGELF